jgi:hypothetical protein
MELRIEKGRIYTINSTFLWKYINYINVKGQTDIKLKSYLNKYLRHNWCHK